MYFLHDSNLFEHFYNQNHAAIKHFPCSLTIRETSNVNTTQQHNYVRAGEAVPHLRLRNPSQTGLSACVEPS